MQAARSGVIKYLARSVNSHNSESIFSSVAKNVDIILDYHSVLREDYSVLREDYSVCERITQFCVKITRFCEKISPFCEENLRLRESVPARICFCENLSLREYSFVSRGILISTDLFINKL